MEQKEFEITIQQIRNRMLSEARHIMGYVDEAEDITQDAVLKLWAMRKELDKYHSVEALAVLMVRRIALNSKRRTTVPTSDYMMSDVASDETPESRWCKKI